MQAVSRLDGNGRKWYAKRGVRKSRPREEQIALPVPAYLPRGLVETARTTPTTTIGGRARAGWPGGRRRAWSIRTPFNGSVKRHVTGQAVPVDGPMVRAL